MDIEIKDIAIIRVPSYSAQYASRLSFFEQDLGIEGITRNGFQVVFVKRDVWWAVLDNRQNLFTYLLFELVEAWTKSVYTICRIQAVPLIKKTPQVEELSRYQDTESVR